MLSERLRGILAFRDLTKEELAEMCDLPVETIKNIYYGKTPDPKVSTVMKISNALQISVNSLMGNEECVDEEKTLLQYFRLSGTHGKSLILLTAKYEALTAKEEREMEGKHLIPCLIPKGDLEDGLVYDSCEVVEIYTTDPNAYTAIKVLTNDLVPVYCTGDVILISNRFPKEGECGVFYSNGKAYIRK